MTVALTYDVCAKGWATVELAIGDNRASFQVIYLTEPLRDLLDSAAAIISGDYSTLEVKFQDEPGEHRMQFGARGERLHVAIFRIEETFSRLQSNRGEEVLSAEWAQNVWRRCFVSGAAGPRRYRRGRFPRCLAWRRVSEAISGKIANRIETVEVELRARRHSA